MTRPEEVIGYVINEHHAIRGQAGIDPSRCICGWRRGNVYPGTFGRHRTQAVIEAIRAMSDEEIAQLLDRGDR